MSQLPVQPTIKVMKWLKKHKSEVESKSVTSILNDIFADTGCTISPGMLRKLKAASGISRKITNSFPSVRNILKVGEWLSQHKTVVPSMTVTATLQAIKADTGCSVDTDTLRKTEIELGIVREKENTRLDALAIMAITEWYRKHKVDAENMTIAEIRNAINIDTGCFAGYHTLRIVEKEVGIRRKKTAEPNFDTKKEEEYNKVLNWLREHKAEAESMTTNNVCRAILKATGVRISVGALRKFETQLGGFNRKRGGANSKVKKDRVKIVADALKTMFERFGEAIPDDLNKLY